MSIVQISEHILRITEEEFRRIRDGYWASNAKTLDLNSLATFLEVDAAEVIFGKTLEVYIEDPVRMLQFKFDWSA